MKSRAFDRSEHVYKNDAFAELVKDAIRFFNGTPVHTLPPPEPFLSTGVYGELAGRLGAHNDSFGERQVVRVRL